MSKSKVFKIPVTWEMTGTIEVEADSIGDAIHMVNINKDQSGKSFSLPNEQEYVKGSFRISDNHLLGEPTNKNK